MLTFGAGSPDFESAGIRIERNARLSGYFSEIDLVNGSLLAAKYPGFVLEHGDFIKANSRGYGLWIWKSYLIWEKLKKLPEGDFLVYLDAGCEVNYSTYSARRRWKKYLKITRKRKILAFQLRNNQFTGFYDLSEKAYNRIDLTRQLNLSESGLESNQIESNFIIFYAGKMTTNFAFDWYELCKKNGREFLLPPSEDLRYPGYLAYREDQSIFSSLMKKKKIQPLLNENYFSPNWEVDVRNYPIWTARNISGIPISIKNSLVREKLFYFFK